MRSHDRSAVSASRERGYVGILTAVLVVVMGLFLAGAFYLIKPIKRETQEELTRRNMEHIIYALSVYSQKNVRLPCPAQPNRSVSSEPFGSERGSGSAGRNFGNCSGAQLEGIVPFRTLGLPENQVRDGWRNFITYRVSDAMVNPAARAVAVPPPRVHDLCRVKDVWVIPSGGGGSDNNVDPIKALFCCGRGEVGFDVRDSRGDSVIPESFENSPTGYQPFHSPAPIHSIHDDEIPDVLSVVLVSHGSNGLGAWLDTNSRIAIGGASAGEAENADNDGIYSFMPRTDTNVYYDDIVFWRTQQLLFSEVGNNSNACDGPRPLPGP